MEEEIEIKLSGDKYIAEFRKMYFNDPIVGSIMLAITKTLQSVEWKVHNDPKGALQKSLDNVNWSEKLEEILMFLVYGFSLFEIVLGEEDGIVVWKAMHTRPQDTIQKWHNDKHGKLISVTQQVWGSAADVEDGTDNAFTEFGTAEIKIAKCLHFASNKTANRPTGISLLRNAYRSWYYKTNFEKLEAIGIERDLTGLPVLTPDEDAVLLDQDGNLNALGMWAWQTVRGVKRNEQEGLVLQPGWTFELQGSPGARQFDTGDVIGRYDAKIAMSVLAQFLLLGIQNDSGSFALASVQSELFNKAVEGFAKMIANVVNHQFIGARGLSLLNDYPKDKPAYIEPVGASKLNMNDMATFLGRLFKFNVITPDDKLEDHVRKMTGLPERDETTARLVQNVNDKLGHTDTQGDLDAIEVKVEEKIEVEDGKSNSKEGKKNGDN
jgi:hypothetical protein